MWLIILFIILGLFVFFRIFVWFFGNWRLSLTRLADSYIYGIEKEKLSKKKAFFKALKLRYQLTKTGELMAELKKQGLSGDEMIKKTDALLMWNSLIQNTEYRYEYILLEKGFIEEAVNLRMSRSLVEGGMRASDKIMDEMRRLYNYKGFIKDGDYSLLDLLVCGMMIEYSHEIKGKSYDEVVKMIKDYFSTNPYFKKYLE